MKSDLILDKLRLKLQQLDPSKRTFTNIFQFNFKDSDEKFIKSVVLDLTALKLFEGTVENPDAQISLTDDEFYLIGTKQVTFDESIKAGKVQVCGNEEALRKIFDKFQTQ